MTQKLSPNPSVDEIASFHNGLISRIGELANWRRSIHLSIENKMKLDPIILELAEQMKLLEQNFAHAHLLMRLNRCRQSDLDELAEDELLTEGILQEAEGIAKEIRGECQTVINPSALN